MGPSADSVLASGLRRLQADQLVVADQVEAAAVGDHWRVAGLVQLEGLAVAAGIDADRLAGLEARGVDGVADHGRRAGYRAADVVAPAPLAAARVERVEVLVVGADVDAGRGAGHASDGWRAIDEVVGGEGPLDLAAPFVEGEDGAIVSGGVDAAEGDRGRGVEAALAERRHLRGVGAPDQLAVLGVEAEHAALVVGDVEATVVETGTRFDRGR